MVANIGVHSTGEVTVADDRTWLVNPIAGGVCDVTLDLTTFVGDGEKEKKYFTGLSSETNVAWLRSGLPLARITESGKLGPYDTGASDGRQLGIAGLLESNIEVEWTRGGLKYDNVTAGMRYMAVIDKSRLTVDVGSASFEGLFYDLPGGNDAPHGAIVPLSKAAGESTATIGTGSVTTDKLAADAVTNGKLADDAVQTENIKDDAVTADKIADGVIPVAATSSKAGLVKQGATVSAVSSADATSTGSSSTVSTTEFAATVTLSNEVKKQLNALISSLKTAGVIA